MSINNYILNLLNIKDENIHIITECKEKVIKNKKYKIVEGILTIHHILVLAVVLLINQQMILLNGVLEKIVLLKFLNKVIV